MAIYASCTLATLFAVWLANYVRFAQCIVVVTPQGKAALAKGKGKAAAPTSKAASIAKHQIHKDTNDVRQNVRAAEPYSMVKHGTSSASMWVKKASALPSTDRSVEVNATAQQTVPMTAPLSEDGYMSVVKLEDNKLMSMYVRRLCAQLRLHVRDEGALEGLLPHFSGVRASQSFFVLKQELLKIAAIPNTWLIEEENRTGMQRLLESSINRFWRNGNTLPLDQRGYAAAAALKSDHQMAQFVKRVAHDLDLAVSNEGKFNGFVEFYSGTKAVQSFAKLRSELINAVRDGESWLASGDSVALDDAGYRSVAGLANDLEMANFIRRVAADFGCTVVDQQQLMRVAHAFTDAQMRSMTLLRKEMRDSCGLSGSERTYGSIHDVVGKDGALQISPGKSQRMKYSSDALRSAAIVPSYFPAVDGHKASPQKLSESCVRAGDKHAQAKCSDKSVFPLGDKAGCRSREEQAIVASHHEALQFSLKRNDSEWTAIIEGDMVPIHPGSFDASFKAAWAKVPPQSKFVRLNWCSERDEGSIRKRTYKNTGNFRLIKEMSGGNAAVGGDPDYYVGGCTTSYIVHRSILAEVLGIFPCCCSIDCCLENQLFYAPSKTRGAKYRGQEILINMDAWDSQDATFPYATFNQGGVLGRDHRDMPSLQRRQMYK